MSQIDALVAGSVSNIRSTKPTPLLKWIDGRLHQQWEIIRYRDHKPVEAIAEWREVPSETTEGQG